MDLWQWSCKSTLVTHLSVLQLLLKSPVLEARGEHCLCHVVELRPWDWLLDPRTLSWEQVTCFDISRIIWYCLARRVSVGQGERGFTKSLSRCPKCIKTFRTYYICLLHCPLLSIEPREHAARQEKINSSPSSLSYTIYSQAVVGLQPSCIA